MQGSRESLTTPPLDGASVRVRAPARLHLGFLDLHGGLGRRFGSLGITLDAPATIIRATRAPRRRIAGPDAARAEAVLLRLAEALDTPTAIDLVIEQAIPAHAGLGSGTQLGLAVGTAVARLAGLDLSPDRIATLIDRGARSGIGIGAFATGGVLLDGGRGGEDRPPPIVARLPFPEGWRILLVQDAASAGLSGAAERRAFTTLPPFPEELAGRLCRLVLMQALPALAEGDVDGFGRAVGELQRRVGDHFAPAQGGRFTSPGVAEALAWIEAQGVPGIGQSSWGPTGFAIVGDPGCAEALLRDARARAGGHPGLLFDCVRGGNSGAMIETASPVAAIARARR